jgi:hypothetical protein
VVTHRRHVEAEARRAVEQMLIEHETVDDVIV